MKTVGAPGRTQNPLSVSGYQALTAAREALNQQCPELLAIRDLMDIAL